MKLEELCGKLCLQLTIVSVLPKNSKVARNLKARHRQAHTSAEFTTFHELKGTHMHVTVERVMGTLTLRSVLLQIQQERASRSIFAS